MEGGIGKGKRKQKGLEVGGDERRGRGGVKGEIGLQAVP